MSCKFEYKGKEYSETELKTVLSYDPEIIKKYGNTQNTIKSPYSLEEKSVFDRKISKLKESMDVEVIMDENVNSSRVLAKSDPRTKLAGKPVILINPKQLFRATAIHEFGHIFIDSFPKGIENPRIKKALSQLAGTDLELEVRELYPDLNEEMFQKELLATAIGREGADIWDKNEDLSIWGIFKDWFTNFINRAFGIPKNEIAGIVNEMISGEKVNRDLVSGLPEIAQQLVGEKVGDPDSKNTKTLQNTYDELLARVSNSLESYRPRTSDQKKREMNRQTLSKAQGDGLTNFQSIESLYDQLIELDKTDKLLGLSKYADWVNRELATLKNIIDDRKLKGTQTPEKLVKGLKWNDAFNMIDELQVLSNELHDEGILSDEDKQVYDTMLLTIQGKRSSLKSEIMQEVRNQYSIFIANTSNEVKEGFKKEFIKDYNNAELGEGSGISVDEYVTQKLIENEAEIKERELLRARERSLKIDADISAFSGKWFSEKNIDSKEIQAISTALDDSDRVISGYASSVGSEFQQNNEAYKINVKDGDAFSQEDKYRKMTDKSSSGKFYLASRYKADFIEEKREQGRATYDNDLAMELYGKIEISATDNTYVINGEKREMIFETGFAEPYVKGSMHVKHTIAGDVSSITKEHAIAKSELEHWLNKNTDKVVKGGKKRIPNESWENKEYLALTPKEKTALEFFKTKALISDKETDGLNSLISKFDGQRWFKFPAVKKSSAQKLTDGTVLEFLKDQWSEVTQRQADDFETEESTIEGTKIKLMKVRADGSNNERLSVPVSFRANLSESDQSLDLHSIFLMNSIASKEYHEKKKLEATAIIILEVMRNRKVMDTYGASKIPKIHASSREGIETPLSKNIKDGLPADAIKFMDVMENRLFGIKSIDAGKIAGKDVNQLTRSWLKLSGSISLLFNWMNDIVNYNMGTAMNLVEAAGGEFFNFKDLAKAKKTYWSEARGLVNDMGSNVQTSRTNLFLNIWNVAGGKEYMNNNFEESTRIRSLMKVENLRALATMGEHMIQSQMMYAIMHNIRVMNKKGQYIDQKGNVVSDKKDAASLDDMIEFKKNDATGSIKMVLNELVGGTTFSPNTSPDKILLETRNLIKSKVMELQGNYSPELQAANQRLFWGKLTFFLRKWTLPGYHRRFRGFSTAGKKKEDLLPGDVFYSEDQKSDKEGYAITGFRFAKNVLMPALLTLKFELVKKGFSELSGMEKANLKKLITEISMIVISYLMFAALDDDDDDDKNLIAKYLVRRQMSELMFFYHPFETYKILSTPTASIGVLNKLIQIVAQMTDPNEEYLSGSNKGRNKLKVKILKTIPVFSQLEKNTKDALSFLEQLKPM